MRLVTGTNPLDTWVKGCVHLLDAESEFNLISEMSDPSALDEQWLVGYNPKKIRHGVQPLSDVASTIFPYKIARRSTNRSQLYSEYLERHERAMRIHRRTGRAWGTYFERLIAFGPNKINQLESVILALNRWSNNRRAALVIHLSSADTDSLVKTMGNPCLQFIEFLCPSPSSLSLLAVYRNHDFFAKTLGNFLGLSWLLSFVAQSTGRNVGSLICHSAHAYFRSTRQELRNLARL